MVYTNVKIEKRDYGNPNGTWVVLADSERFGNQAVMFESYRRKEAEEYAQGLFPNAQVLVGLAKRTEQFRKFQDRVFGLTSSSDAYDTTVEYSNEGAYIMFDGARSSYNRFYTWDGSSIRKPKTTSPITIRLERGR